MGRPARRWGAPELDRLWEASSPMKILVCVGHEEGRHRIETRLRDLGLSVNRDYIMLL